MLRWFDSDTNLRLNELPHQPKYAVWTARLQAAGQLGAAFDFIDDLIEKGTIHTSSWMPGNDWRGTPLQPIYETAARQSHQQAGWCFGLMLMQKLVEHREQWYCKKDPEVAGGTIYWTAPAASQP